jgi:RNA recognition motif-containing protein
VFSEQDSDRNVGLPIHSPISARLFIGYVPEILPVRFQPKINGLLYRGLAWHTTDKTLREKFQEFGKVEEAVIIW